MFKKGRLFNWWTNIKVSWYLNMLFEDKYLLVQQQLLHIEPQNDLELDMVRLELLSTLIELKNIYANSSDSVDALFNCYYLLAEGSDDCKHFFLKDFERIVAKCKLTERVVSN